MERIRVIHDTAGHTLTIWLGDPQQEYVSTLTDDEVVVMKIRMSNSRIRSSSLPASRT